MGAGVLDVASGKIYTGCQPPNKVIALYKLSAWARAGALEIKSALAIQLPARASERENGQSTLKAPSWGGYK